MSNNNSDKLFESFTVGGLALKNRTVMAPMTRTFSPNYIPNSDVAKYYRRRAAGNVGLIITEGTFISHKAANGYERVPAIFGEEALAGWKHVVDEVHAAGGKIVPQIWHVGSVRKEGIGPDKSVPAYSPSGLYKPGTPNGVEMSQVDIDEVVASFAQAALDAKNVGFDGVEVHGAHGYLVDQFFWEGTNQRVDGYGGSLENRTRFGVEIVQAIRAAVGNDFPIIFRFSQWKQQDYHAKLCQNPEELALFLSLLSEAGVDIFHASTRRFWLPEFEGSTLNLAGWTKKLTQKPVITVGSVGLDSDFTGEGNTDLGGASNPTGIEGLLTRLNNDEFDLVAIGRALLVDPEWVNKIRDKKEDQIAPFNKDALMKLS
ncbi:MULTISPECIES: NADH:flavin oxidoreductase [unclassified Colwellia]|uniref:NADH:flavin oxidoreductase n=1 Tax=unclassified Colwellia TaxID=196834 RepID=UPI0015F51FCF|nr:MULTISPECIES: NADH:flavin oxidoreductase [unclassified Colwellia]MBA6233834.1 NADH:flavin oxidoreductase [Colwellia sp. MB02u-7]MBA6237350.1 NADH:flavin oxidoreductase [Colwellia sp. MB02u-11]MBA6256480.1 NADH:flavin oxidoreductase [Colwellia sp. MB3u-28]MBA6260317.1 NADH:flavin oxidoreductase [Colwellia sp. MB3u-41]MBA6300350.1 NADH:flavin oxidoreductase [Colwellia sp. MB3u-22]